MIVNNEVERMFNKAAMGPFKVLPYKQLVEKVKKIMKNLDQCNCSRGRDFNPGPSEHKTNLLTSRPIRLVCTRHDLFLWQNMRTGKTRQLISYPLTMDLGDGPRLGWTAGLRLAVCVCVCDLRFKSRVDARQGTEYHVRYFLLSLSLSILISLYSKTCL
jgi:hypothetical protein